MAESTRQAIEAPAVEPPRYGLVAVAATPNDIPIANWIGGWRFTPAQCGVAGREAIECDGGVGGTLDPSRRPAIVEGDPFYVWAGDECGMAGYLPDDAEERAREQLAATESFEIANELWTGDVTDVPRPLSHVASDRVTTGAVDPVTALALLEQAVAFCSKGRRGMVHMTPQLLDHLAAATAIHMEGPAWYTPLGNTVVADAGYTGSHPGNLAPGATQFMYGTGMVRVLLGPVEVIGDISSQLDRSVNTRTTIAGRPAGVQWDQCCHFAAEVNVAPPAIGGAS